MNRFLNDLHTSDRVYRTLARLEDTVICALTERAQSGLDRPIYIPGALGFNNMVNRSFLEYFLWETEKMHAKTGRYVDQQSVGTCYPFTSPLPLPSARSCGRGFSFVDNEKFLCPNDVNVNEDIMRAYIKAIVPSICENRDDGQYGSSAIRDIECLEALSRRIHYAKFIAENRFRANPEIYTRLARANDRQGIYDQLTDRDHEVRTLDRLGRKAIVYGQTLEKDGRTTVQQVINMYDRWIIPLVKQVEVDYLMIRGRWCEEE